MVQWLLQRARPEDSALLAPLFDAYRQFYQQPGDLALAERFLRERLAAGESVVFYAGVDGDAAGFIQLYPSHCSVAARPIFVLYDLYVAPRFRRLGLAEALLAQAADFARGAGAERLELATALGNHPAQALYEKLGWVRERDFYRYALTL